MLYTLRYRSNKLDIITFEHDLGRYEMQDPDTVLLKLRFLVKLFPETDLNNIQFDLNSQASFIRLIKWS